MEPYLNDESFVEIYHQLKPFALGTAVNFVKDKALAQDLVTDGFVKLWDHRFTIPDFNRAKAFLMICICNQARNACRHKNVRVHNEHALVSLFDASLDDNCLNKLIKSEFMAQIYAGIEELSPEKKKVIKLAYIDGLSNHEICKVLKKSIYTVKEQKGKALKQLRGLFRGVLIPVLFLFCSCHPKINKTQYKFDDSDSTYHKYLKRVTYDCYWIYPNVCLHKPTPEQQKAIDYARAYMGEAADYFRQHPMSDDPCKRPYYTHDTLNFNIDTVTNKNPLTIKSRDH